MQGRGHAPLPCCFLPDAGAEEQETSMNRFVSVCGMALALGVGMAAVSRAESGTVQSDPAPGGLLRSRAEAYWRLLAAGDRDGASGFLRPEDRSYFLEHPEPPFQDPEVRGIEPSADGDPGRCPDRIQHAHTGRTVSMGGPAGLDLRRWGMGGGTPPEYGQPLPIPPCDRGGGSVRRYGMPSLTAGWRQPRTHR